MKAGIRNVVLILFTLSQVLFSAKKSKHIMQKLDQGKVHLKLTLC